MKRLFTTLFSLILCLYALAATISGGTKLYLNPGSDWTKDNARFAAYYFSSGSNAWASMTAVSGTSYYQAVAPSGSWEKIIFCRMNGSTAANSWDNKWNQTGDLSYDGYNNLFSVPSGVWDGATSKWTHFDDGPSSSTYYIAGSMNGWNAKGQELADGTYTFQALAAGTYEFKITNGTWDVSFGYEALECKTTTIACTESGEYGGNISFTLDAPTDVTITFSDNKISITVPGGKPNCGGTGGKVGCYYVKPGMRDVMLQAFYYDGYGGSEAEFNYNTKWETLDAQANALSRFDIVWLPPSAMGVGTGYHPKQWSNQNSEWGSAAQLKKLVADLHGEGVKVMADIVVNHRDNKSTWCDFYPDDFGEYGSFQLTAEHICKDDEVNKGNNGCKATGNNDTGYMGVDQVDGVWGAWPGARDLDHTSQYVRNDVKAYLLWLKNVIGYDAWRWDMGKGFAPTYFNEYNFISDPYLSVIEMWEGNQDVLADFLKYCRPESDYNKSWDDANPGTMLFDFATKYQAVNEGVGAAAFENLKGKGMLGAGNARYAVTFVDNHDTYRNGSCLAKIGDGKNKIMQAYAYLLSMPGVPCVFYPHWKAFSTQINALIDARHAVGVNSTSPVDDSETGDNTYRAAIQGTKGYLILRVGADIYGHEPGSDYKIAAEGYGYRVYVPKSVTLGDLPQSTKYYITGKDLAGSWEPNALLMPDGTYTFTNLAAGSYTFKITTGTWDTNFGYTDLGAVKGETLSVSGDDDGNIVLYVAEAQDVVISIAHGRVVVEGQGKPLQKGVTYTVTVPTGTTSCYIVGEWDWNTFTPMQQVSAHKFTVTLDDNTTDMVYKYTCCADWKCVELTADGGDVSNRSYSSADEVARWAQTTVTAIGTTEDDGTLQVCVNGGVLTVSMAVPQDITVYDASGRKIYSANDASELTLPLASGIYFLRTPAQTRKVAVR